MPHMGLRFGAVSRRGLSCGWAFGAVTLGGRLRTAFAAASLMDATFVRGQRPLEGRFGGPGPKEDGRGKGRDLQSRGGRGPMSRRRSGHRPAGRRSDERDALALRGIGIGAVEADLDTCDHGMHLFVELHRIGIGICERGEGIIQRGQTLDFDL